MNNCMAHCHTIIVWPSISLGNFNCLLLPFHISVDLFSTPWKRGQSLEVPVHQQCLEVRRSKTVFLSRRLTIQMGMWASCLQDDEHRFSNVKYLGYIPAVMRKGLFGSQFEGSQQGWEDRNVRWLVTLHPKSGSRQECRWSVFSPFFSLCTVQNAGSQSAEWRHPLSEWVFPLQYSLSGNIIGDMQRHDSRWDVNENFSVH